jgi:hypothetical protein
MSDEAAPYYVDMVDQQTIGHQFLLSNFGPSAIPKTGWQVNFHSRLSILIFSKTSLFRSILSVIPELWPPFTPSWA